MWIEFCLEDFSVYNTFYWDPLDNNHPRHKDVKARVDIEHTVVLEYRLYKKENISE